jgi:hypothetical protein
VNGSPGESEKRNFYAVLKKSVISNIYKVLRKIICHCSLSVAGFSDTALNLIRQKVQEESSRGCRVLLSVTFDEMAIRKFVCLRG